MTEDKFILIRVTGWRHVYKLTRLKELTLALTRNFTAEGYADIAKLNNLTFLNVNANSNINDPYLEKIFRMTNLESLSFTDVSASHGQAFSGLVNMTKLQKLHGMILPDETALSYLSQVYSLTRLGIRFPGNQSGSIPAQCISPLTRLKVLLSGTLSNTNVLSSLVNLEELNSSEQSLNAEFPFEVMKNLTGIIVRDMDSKALQKLTNLANFKSLSVRHILNPQEDDFSGIEKCQKLFRLHYAKSLITEKRKFIPTQKL